LQRYSLARCYFHFLEDSHFCDRAAEPQLELGPVNLDLEGVAASYGSACQSGSPEVSRVLLAMGIPHEEAASSIRLSFGRFTTEMEIDELLKIIERVAGRMKG